MRIRLIRHAAVHMDTINHCRVTRELLRSRLEAENKLAEVRIPLDGEWFELS